MADPAPVFPFRTTVPSFGKHDPPTTSRTKRWFERWRILEFLEIEFVRRVPTIHFERKVVPAAITALPGSDMAFGVMIRADCLTSVIAETAVLRIREQDIFVLVIADWSVAAGSSGKSFARPAEPADEFLRLGHDEPQLGARVLSLLGHRRLTSAVHPRGRARDILAGWNTCAARPRRVQPLSWAAERAMDSSLSIPRTSYQWRGNSSSFCPGGALPPRFLLAVREVKTWNRTLSSPATPETITPTIRL